MFDISVDTRKLDFLREWHSSLKENKRDSRLVAQDSYSITSVIVTCCYIACFLVNTLVIKHDRQSQYLFLHSLLTVLIAFVYYYPYETLNISGYVHLRILKWILITISLSTFCFLIHSQPFIFSSFLFCTAFSVKLLHTVPLSFPNTFTLTELIICVNLLAGGLFTYLIHLLKVVPDSSDDVTVIEQALMWFVIVVIFTRKLEIAKQSLAIFTVLCVFILLTFFIPVCIILINENAFIWLFNYIFTHDTRVYLIIYWLFLFICISAVVTLQKGLQNAKLLTPSSLTSARKLFHLLICCVFIPGLLYDVEFLTLCSFGMLILLCLIELVRYYEISSLSEIIDDVMELFIDRKDLNGEFVLSHIYLLIGLSFPIWISNFHEFRLCQFSGIVTIGVGDTFASLVGSNFGYHKWPRNHKSIEGTLAFMFSQAAFYYALYAGGFLYFDNPFHLVYIFISILISALVEALAKDNDNLILSISVYPFLSMIQ